MGSWTRAVTAMYVALGPTLDISCGMLDQEEQVSIKVLYVALGPTLDISCGMLDQEEQVSTGHRAEQ